MTMCGTVFRYFGGVQVDMDFGIDYEKLLLELIHWLLPLTVCLLAEGVWLERRSRMESLARYRYGTDKRWWRVKFLRGLRFGISVGAILFCTAAAADMMSPRGIYTETRRAFLMWFFHFMTMLSLFMVLDLAGVKGQAPGALLLLEGLSFLAGILIGRFSMWTYGRWGMYFQSEWFDKRTGLPVSVILAVEAFMVALSYGAGRILLKKGGK